MFNLNSFDISYYLCFVKANKKHVNPFQLVKDLMA